MFKKFIFSFILFSALCSLLSAHIFAQTAQEEDTFLLAKKAFDDGFYEAGLALLNRFLDNFPASSKANEAHFYIGQCYFYQKKYDEAVNQFNTLLSSQAIADFSLEQRGGVYYWLAEAFFKKNDFSKAYDFYQKLLSEYPQSSYYPHAFYSLGWCLFEQGKFQEAKEKFIEFKNKFPIGSLAQEADFKIAECLYHLKDYAKLKSHLELYLKSGFEGEEPEVLKFYLAESCYYLEDYPCAIDNYNHALKLTKDNNLISLIELGLGWCYLKTNEYVNAKAQFDKILKNQAEGKIADSALLGEALSLQMSLQPDLALESYEKLIVQTKNPDTRFEAHLGKAEVLYGLERYQEAIAVYNEARRSLGIATDKPALERLSYGLGLTYLKTKDFQSALNEFSSLANKTGDIKIKIASRSKIGDTYLESGDIQKAINVYESILKEYPPCESCDYVHNSLAMAFSHSEEYGKAIELFKTIIQKYPQSDILDEAVFYLGKTYYDTEDYLSSYLQLRNFKDKFPASNLKMQAILLEGLSLKSLKRYQEAYDIFKLSLSAVQEADLLARAEFEMSECLYSLGQIDEALTHFEILRTKYPGSEIFHLVLLKLASHYFQENKLDLSRRYLLDLINSRPEVSLLDDGYFALSLCYEKEGKYQEALEALKKVETNKVRAYPKMAQVYRAMGNLKDAIFYYQMSLKEKQVNPALSTEDICYYRKGGVNTDQIQFQLAECLEESGQLSQAIERYSHLSEDKPLMVKGLLRCGTIYENKGDWQSAIHFYQKIVDLNVEESKFAKERIAIIKEDYLSRRKYE